MAAVKSFSTDTILKQYPKRILAIQLSLATVLPASCVLAVFRTVSYRADPLLLAVCLPGESYMAFYTLTLPSQVITACGITMTILIVRRIKQSSALRSSIRSSNNQTTIAQAALTRRFLVLVVSIPLCFVTAYTMIEVHSKFWGPSYYAEVRQYIVCQMIKDENECSSLASTRLAVLIAIVPLCFALFGLTLLVYSLTPAPARQLWSSHFKWFCGFLKTCKTSGDSVGDRDTEAKSTSITET
jgi:hypothetical protein